jgi:phage terminase small subunit
MGRPAYPPELHLMNGNKAHLTKAEIKMRKEAEIKLGEQKIVCPTYVKQNKTAYKKWKELKKLYDQFPLTTSADAGIMSRYCMAFAEYEDLIQRRAEIADMELDSEEEEKMEAALEEQYGTRRAAKMFEKIEYILSTAGLLSIDKAINAKMGAILNMEGRLFLSPLDRVKNVPKRPEKKEDPMQKGGFDV